MSGTVKEYEAGKKIKLTGPGDKTYAFELGESARVEGAIVVGQMATVKYTKGYGRERNRRRSFRKPRPTR